ncbi:MAG: ATP-binding cassette domain-containing protein [Syntrophobacteraceae bacterium]|nr:ATP-binding cassette domain-containing protein [Syntrophobacteraceae bacterium]
MTGPMLQAENLRWTEGGRDIVSVRELVLAKGEVLAVVGPNGAGKSSLLLMLALLQKPTEGTIRIDGEPTHNGNRLDLRRRMATVFQESLLLDCSVQHNISWALRIRGVSRREADRRTAEWLERFGIGHLARRAARHLSGGEAQRTSLARAFALEPDILFLDEPFSALDYPTRNQLIEELGVFLRETGTTTFFVTHDFSEIPRLAGRVVVLYEGKPVREGTVREIFGEEGLKWSAWVPWRF